MNGFKNPDEDGHDAARLVSLADTIFENLGLKDPLTRRFIAAALQCVRVYDYKQGKYGPGNIAKFGERGVLVRVSDKLERMINLHKTEQEPDDETRDDTWGDMATYALIALMCRWGWWPGVEGARRLP